VSNLDWMDKSLCRNEDPEIFFPSAAGPKGQLQAEQAARICARCPVQRECGEHRAHTGASTGVWGGMYRNLKDPAATRTQSPHGTTTRYRNGCRCDRCRTEHMYTNRKWPRR